jgi:hypothetical protein
MSRVPVLRQGSHRDIGNVSGVDERLGDVPGREGDLATK